MTLFGKLRTTTLLHAGISEKMALLQYEDLRKKNLEENKRFLAEIGLLYRVRLDIRHLL